MKTKKLDEIINNLEYLKRLDAITEIGEETLIEMKAIKQVLSQHDVIGMFSEEQMEQAWTDGADCGETRSGFFNIENYR